MFNLSWVKTKNLIKLNNSRNKKIELKDARPVFFEELDILGFDKHYTYPKVEAPLLWAVGRNYYYKGEKIASVTGGNIYSAPELKTIHKGKIEPVNLEALLELNKELLLTLESEAKEFIYSIYQQYKDKHNFGVAFSGGKDSQVILDLVLQVIPPSDFYTIFSDTEMELPDTYKTITDTINKYSSEFSGFNFLQADQYRPTIENWSIFGPPSRLHRWCCTVCKSVPYLDRITKEIGASSNILVFEGVRREESSNRSNYSRIAEGVKQTKIINSRPILNWKNFEVYLYLFYKKIKLNNAYRYGLSRVGCVVCPFSSDWSEFLLNKIYPEVCSPFFSVIKENLHKRGIHEDKLIKDYIANGNWKVRGGEDSLEPLECEVNIDIENEWYSFEIKKPFSNIEEWLKTIPILSITQKENIKEYQCKINNKLRTFTISINEEKIILIKCKKIEHNDLLIRFLRKISYKTAYCNNCKVCSVECPTGAITMTDFLFIDKNKCINCQRCLNIADNGCLVSKSRNKRGGKNKMNTTKIPIDKYSTFGLQENWLINYLEFPKNWDEGLGVKKIPAFRRWLEDSNLMEKKAPTKLYHLITKRDLLLIWQIIFINLSYGSEIVKWYTTLEFKTWGIQELLDILDSTYYHKRTSLNNPLKAMINIFNNSEVLTNENILGNLKKKGNTFVSLERIKSNNISPIALVYCLYKFAEQNEYYDLSLNELYRDDMEHTPYKIFGIEKEEVKRILTGLQDNKNGILRVEFAASLDNIYLNKDFKSLDVLEIMLEG